MSYLEPDPIKESNDAATYFSEIALRMGLGAAFGAVIFFGTLVAIYVLYLLGTLLPPESKEADDPTPDSFGYVIEAKENELA